VYVGGQEETYPENDFESQAIWNKVVASCSEIGLKELRKTTENSGQPNGSRRICKEVIYCPILKYCPD
jgi:hypothetical protein